MDHRLHLMDNRLTCARKVDLLQFAVARFTGFDLDHCSSELRAVLLLDSTELKSGTS